MNDLWEGAVTVLEVWTRASSNIDQRAKTLSPRQVALFLVTVIPLTIGFVVFLAWKAVWSVVSWVWAAGIEGWDMGKALTRKGEGT